MAEDGRCNTHIRHCSFLKLYHNNHRAIFFERHQPEGQRQRENRHSNIPTVDIGQKCANSFNRSEKAEL